MDASFLASLLPSLYPQVTAARGVRLKALARVRKNSVPTTTTERAEADGDDSGEEDEARLSMEVEPLQRTPIYAPAGRTQSFAFRRSRRHTFDEAYVPSSSFSASSSSLQQSDAQKSNLRPRVTPDQTDAQRRLISPTPSYS